jgi:protein-tyrosine phosphatase
VGGYPGSRNPAEARGKAAALVNTGIRVVFNLMEPEELSLSGRPYFSYEEALSEAAFRRGAQVFAHRVPVQKGRSLSQAEMAWILDRVDEALAQGLPVYLHSAAGRGRAVTVAGCYLARHGIAVGDAALHLLRGLRRVTADSHRPAPETMDQAQMVRDWKVGE